METEKKLVRKRHGMNDLVPYKTLAMNDCKM